MGVGSPDCQRAYLTRKLQNCQGSDSSMPSRSSPNPANRLRRHDSGSQSAGPENEVPRYFAAVLRTGSHGRSSGTLSPSFGFSNIQVSAAMIDPATCSVVAFWLGTTARASSMDSSDPVHHALYGWPISSTPS